MTNIEILKDILLQDNVIYSIEKNEKTIFNIIPILENEKGFDQNNPWHCYDVWEHTKKAIETSPKDFDIRLVLLLHDIGKPFSYQDDTVRHFKGHAEKSRMISKPILQELKCQNIDELLFLIEKHASKIDLEEVTIDNKDLYDKLFIVQLCDASAYEKEHAKEMISKLNEDRNKLHKINFASRKELT